MGKYYDIRQDFWRNEFEKALPYDEYLASGEEKHRNKWQEMAKKMDLANPQREVLAGLRRKMNVLFYSGIWCGDCVRQGPMLKAIAEANPVLKIRYVEREEGSALSDELRINGAAKVPVAVFLSEDFFELGRFGDRLLTVYRRMARTQFGPACDTGFVPPPADEMAAEMQEWIDIFERMQIILHLSPMLRERYGD
ncbi:thioredoxin family protein [bacterium]|nr:thioredoxin family protein [bacterium]